MTTQQRRRGGERGTTLLEAMIALTILLVGIIGSAKLQIYGMASTQGARAQTQATQLATELANAIALLDMGDPRLTGTAGTSPPSPFGRVLGATSNTSVHAWDDSNPIAGARLDATLERDPTNAALPAFQRHWTVWDAGVASTGTAAKIVAVSVIWRERTIATPREIVVYVNSQLSGAFMANINAFH